MTDTHGSHHRRSRVFSTENMKLTSSASEQNVYFTYVCLVDDLRPTESITPTECDNFDKQYSLLNLQNTDGRGKTVKPEGSAIQVERTKAVHELVEAMKNNKSKNDEGNCPAPTTSGEDSESETEHNTFLSCDNPNILKLTKMKWLSEDPDSAHDSSSPSVSSATSNTSSCSKNSECDVTVRHSFDDKYLSTILRLDKEHNMFGLSSIAIVGSNLSKQKRGKDEEKPVFPQTAIVQICCAKGCCRNMSKTDLPASLKCGACRGCFFDPNCIFCASVCNPLICDPPPPCNPPCGACPRSSCNCKGQCPPLGCKVDCTSCFGLKIKLNRKAKYDPAPVELTPRSSCILHKPFAARSCHHLPQCVPPSSCFPYLMPCFWPARPSAPCSTPTRCFHNPPCPAPRQKRRVPLPPQYKCPRHPPCGGKDEKDKQTKCTNEVCPGNIPAMRQAIESRFGRSK
ncbi:uncharacterized protein LOC142977099 isoform X2 [Anticarsia gemmatalis]|uniref:uncharacterized protein LOC142977099 isoform X2 n=1 Tax=Anticarsia gemmatalis TaxID=129554 RepID=UPI003F7675CD